MLDTIHVCITSCNTEPNSKDQTGVFGKVPTIISFVVIAIIELEGIENE